MIQYGFIDSVSVVNAGGSLREDALTGSTVLAIDDAIDFNEDGGAVEINGTVYNYVGADLDSEDNTVTLATGLIEDLETGHPIYISPIAPEKRASVILADNGDTIDARVPHNLFDRVPEGIRDNGAGESVTIDLIGNEYVLTDIIGKQPVIDGAYINPETIPAPSTDGFPPEASPQPIAIGGLGSIFVRWSAITNADPVTYALHVSTSQEFTPDSTTLLATTPGSSLTVKAMPDDTPFTYGVDYYFRVVASDADGDAPSSSFASAQVIQVNSADIAANYGYFGQILADQIVGGTISSDVTLSSTIKTADSGARVEMSPSGLLITDSTGAPTTSLGTDGTNFFKGNVEANGLTVTGGATFRSTTNELSRAAVMTLQAGTTASTNQPTVVVDWEKVALKEGTGNLWPTPGNLRGLSRTPDGKWIAADTSGAFHKWNSDGTWVSTTPAPLGLNHVVQVTSGGPYFGAVLNGSTFSLYRLTEDPVFSDDFSGTLSGWDWNFSSNPLNGSYTTESGKAKIVAQPGEVGGSGTDVWIGRNLAGSFKSRGVHAKYDAPTGLTGSSYVSFQVMSTAENTTFQFFIQGGNMQAIWTLNSVSDWVQVPYDPVQHAWLRIYEMNGRINFQTSPDGVTWSTMKNVSHGRPASVFADMQWINEVNNGGTEINLISNSGFESNTSGWTPLGTATLTRTTDQEYNGFWSGLLQKPSQNDNVQMQYQPIAVGAGKSYTASGMAKGTKATDLISYIEFNWYDADGNWLDGGADNQENINNTGWTTVSETQTAPADATSLVLTYATYDFSTSSWNAKTYWDEMRLIDNTTNTAVLTFDNAKYYGVVGGQPFVRTNTSQVPALGYYATTGDLLVAEHDSANNKIQVRRMSTADMSTVVTTFNSAANPGFSGPLAGVLRGNFDFPEERYITNALGATGTNWWPFKNSDGTYMSGDAFPVITGGNQGIGYDGTNFWALGSDGNLYKHTNIKWTNGTDSASWQAGFTWYDGGSQESTPSPYTTITMKMRARLTVTSPAIPYTGAGDPDRIRIYVGRGGGTKYRQTTTAAFVNAATLTTITFSGTAAPTVNTFASATPAKIRNTSDSLIISADGSGKFASLFIGSDEVLANPPYWYGYLSSNVSVAGTGSTNITTWVTDGSPSSSGITYSAGTFTVPRAGRYRITAQLWYGLIASPTGVRTVQAIGVVAGTLASHTVAPSSLAATPALVSKTVRMDAGDQFFIRATSGQATTIAGTTKDISYVNVEYVGP